MTLTAAAPLLTHDAATPRAPRMDLGERLCVAVLVAALVLLPFPQFPNGLVANMLFAALAAMAWLARPHSVPFHGPVAAYVTLMALSLFWSEHWKIAAPEVFQAFTVVFAGLLVAKTLPLHTILRTLSTAAFFIGALSLALGFFYVGRFHGPAYTGTLIGIYIHKNMLASVMLFGGILPTLFRTYDASKRWRRVPMLALFIVVLTQTQSSTVNALALVVFVIWFACWWVTRATPLARAALAPFALVPVIVGVFFAGDFYRAALEALGRDATLTGRTAIWQVALQAWEQNKLLGVGWGSWQTDSTVSQLQVTAYGWIRDHAHSGYLMMLAQLGLAGAVLVGIMLLWALGRSYRVMVRTQSLMNGWMLAAVVAFVGHNIVEQSMKALPLFILALAWGCATAARDSSLSAGRAQEPGLRSVGRPADRQRRYDSIAR